MASPFKDSGSSRRLEEAEHSPTKKHLRGSSTLSCIPSVDNIIGLSGEHQPLIGAERSGDVSRQLDYSTLERERTTSPDHMNTARGEEGGSSSFVDAFLKFVCCKREGSSSPVQDSPPRAASAVPGRVETQPPHSAILIPRSILSRREVSSLEGIAITSTKGDSHFSEPLLWEQFNESTSVKFKQQMEKICDQNALVIYHRAKLFLDLDKKLKEEKSARQASEFKSIANDPSREGNDIIKRYLDAKDELQKKFGELDKDDSEMYQSLQRKRTDFKQKQEELEAKQRQLEKKETDFRDYQERQIKKEKIREEKIREERRQGPSSRASRVSRASSAASSMHSMYEEDIANLKKRINELPGEIKQLEKEIATLGSQGVARELDDEYKFIATLEKERDNVLANVHREVNQILEEDTEIQGLKQKRDDAEERMLCIAKDVKGQINKEQINDEQYNHYLENIQRAVGERMIGITTSRVERERTGLPTQELPIMTGISNTKEYRVSAFIVFAISLRDLYGPFSEMHEESLKRIGGQFKDKHEGKLMDAISEITDKLGKDLPSADKKNFEIAQKIWQEKPLSQEEKQTLEDTLIRTRQGDTLSPDAKGTLDKIVQKVWQEKPLSQEEKKALDDMLMESLNSWPEGQQGQRKASMSSTGGGVFRFDEAS
ncbi:MAG TPA: hypothetical protein VGL94_09970 [Ktedonobacteraceae bacterium]|jgi:hypothetical protein